MKKSVVESDFALSTRRLLEKKKKKSVLLLCAWAMISLPLIINIILRAIDFLNSSVAKSIGTPYSILVSLIFLALFIFFCLIALYQIIKDIKIDIKTYETILDRTKKELREIIDEEEQCFCDMSYEKSKLQMQINLLETEIKMFKQKTLFYYLFEK